MAPAAPMVENPVMSPPAPTVRISFGDPEPAPILHVATVRRDDEAMVVLRGELDVATAPALAAELSLEEVAGARRVLFDLEYLQFADLTGFDPLVDFALPARPEVRVAFTPGPSAIRRLMAITGLDARLNMLGPGPRAAWG